VVENRNRVLKKAYSKHPERFRNKLMSDNYNSHLTTIKIPT